MTSSPTSRFSTITTTRTMSSPKITRTMTATITTYGLPTHFLHIAFRQLLVLQAERTGMPPLCNKTKSVRSSDQDTSYA
jgi:hypothetical protein